MAAGRTPRRAASTPSVQLGAHRQPDNDVCRLWVADRQMLQFIDLATGAISGLPWPVLIAR